MTLVLQLATSSRVGRAKAIPALLFAWSGVAVMWLFWTSFIIFLAQPVAVMAWWPFATVDRGGWNDSIPGSVAFDIGLIALFGLQHSVMARPRFKSWQAHWVAEPYERCLFIHMANASLFAMILLWQPLPTEILALPKGWPRDVAWVLFGVGWLILFAGAWSFGILELLGVRQMQKWLRDKRVQAPALKTDLIYRWIPHPMYVGVLMGVWITPVLTVGHLLLASGLTVYVLIGMHYEERDLVRRFGPSYQRWRMVTAERRRAGLSWRLRQPVTFGGQDRSIHCRHGQGAVQMAQSSTRKDECVKVVMKP